VYRCYMSKHSEHQVKPCQHCVLVVLVHVVRNGHSNQGLSLMNFQLNLSRTPVGPSKGR